MADLIINSISIEIEGKKIFNDLSLSFNKGKIYLITAPSGRGKTTLAKAICGHLPLCAGSISFDPQNINKPSSEIFLVNQQDDIFPWLKVLEQLEAFGSTYEDGLKLLRDAKLEEAKDLFPHQLSGGMKKRLALLRADSLNSKVIILDETLSFIDQEMSLEILKNIILKWKNENKIVIIISHHFSEIISFIDEKIVLN